MLEPTQRSARASAASTSTSSFNEWRIIIIVPLVVLSFLFTALLAKAPIALAYACGNKTSGNHCYGRQTWPFGKGVTGSQTTVTVASLSCTSGCVNDGSIDNEMWLIDTNTNACTSNQFGQCWVEVGYANDAVGFGGSTYHFWADVRPVDGKYYLHPITNYLFEGRLHHRVFR